MDKFYNLIYRLRFIKRWATSFSKNTEDVMQHSFSVATISHILSIINNRINERNLDVNKIAAVALYHDSFECFTSHIVSPVKNTDTDFKNSYNSMKNHYISRLASSLPIELKNDLKSFIYGLVSEEEREIIEAADTLDAYLFCKFQVKTGNFDYLNKLNLMKQRVDTLKKNLNYVDYFLENLCDFENLEIDY